MKWALFVLSAAAMAAGCAGVDGSRSDDAVAYHMRMADSLEQEMALRGAAEHYAAVAEGYPQSGAYPVAVRKAAILYSSEFNEARNDSLALHWFTAYLGLPLKKAERENVQTFVSLLQRTRTLREELNRRTMMADSLGALARRQAGTLNADTRRIQDLEAELQKAEGELKKIKDIDLRLSRSRGRK